MIALRVISGLASVIPWTGLPSFSFLVFHLPPVSLFSGSCLHNIRGMFCTSFGLLCVLALLSFSNAFFLFSPNTTSPFAPITVSYKRRPNDPQTWSLLVSRQDGTQAMAMEESIFSNSQKGKVQTKLPSITGALVLKAVNPSNLSDSYAISGVFMSVDTGATVANVADAGASPPPPEGALPFNPAASGPSTTPSGTATDLPQSTDTGVAISSSQVLKTPIIVGAAVGSAVVLLAIIIVVLIIYRRRVRSRPMTFYRERMVRQPDHYGPRPLSPASSFEALMPRSPPQLYYSGKMREKGDEESFISLPSDEKR